MNLPEIRSEIIDAATGNESGMVCRKLLEGEISGAAITFMEFSANTREALPEVDEVRIFVFIRGTGTVSLGDNAHDIPDTAIAVLPPDLPGEVQAGESPLQCIEIRWELQDADQSILKSKGGIAPYFIAYADCPTYRESIKSETTVSRTLIDEHRIPRFCMGSVEAQGPDLVAAHEHPMLEQLFFGLPGNDCTVFADDSEIHFPEFMLLHIPLGSSHGVRVEAGKTMHYIWMDFFMSQDGMAWITQQHIPEDDSK